MDRIWNKPEGGFLAKYPVNLVHPVKNLLSAILREICIVGDSRGEFPSLFSEPARTNGV
jgi:hypothetical protein